MKIGFFIIIALAIFAGVFEFYPVIEKARAYVHLSNYENLSSCDVLLRERPWYGHFNHWFFLWLVTVPVLIFMIRPDAPLWLRSGRIILALFFGYVAMNLAVHLQWEIRNAPFKEDPFHPDPLNGWRMDCADYAGDGFSYLLALYLSWIPAGVYTGICLLLWGFYHLRISRIMSDKYQGGIVACVVVQGVKFYFILVLLFILLVVINAGFGGDLYDIELMFLPYYLLIRPLLIPLDILLL